MKPATGSSNLHPVPHRQTLAIVPVRLGVRVMGGARLPGWFVLQLGPTNHDPNESARADQSPGAVIPRSTSRLREMHNPHTWPWRPGAQPQLMLKMDQLESRTGPLSKENSLSPKEQSCAACYSRLSWLSACDQRFSRHGRRKDLF